MRDERRGDIVLRGKRIRRAQQHIRAAFDESTHQIRGFGGDMQTRRDFLAL
jgi:hypothetical protein